MIELGKAKLPPKWPDDYDAETVAMSGGTGMAALAYVTSQRITELESRLAAVTAERDAVRELLRRAKPEIYLDSHGNPELVKEIDAALAAPAGEVQP
jgi:hypothetical protein